VLDLVEARVGMWDATGLIAAETGCAMIVGLRTDDHHLLDHTVLTFLLGRHEFLPRTHFLLSSVHV